MKMSFIVQMSCRLRAAIAALALPIGQLGTLGVRLARSRSPNLREPVKTEGKIKGPVRARPLSQSVRGVGAARRLAACVPRLSTNPQGIRVSHVSPLMRFAALRWSLCHGLT